MARFNFCGWCFSTHGNAWKTVNADLALQRGKSRDANHVNKAT